MDPLKELEGLDAGRQLALVKKLGGRKIVNAILRDEKTVTIEDVMKLFFDKHGRRIPNRLQTNVCDANRDLRLNQPKLDKEMDFANRILRLHESLSMHMMRYINNTEVTAEQLKQETERLLAIIRVNPQIANIANGVYLPVVLPRLVTNDLGAELELYLTGVDKSYSKTFGDRKFYNHCKDTLANEVRVVDGSRHDQLISRMKEGPVIGLHFPNPLQGFSTNASREQISKLPEGFILSGIDTPIAMVMYPDILARDWNTPGLNMSALSWQSAGYSLLFRAGGGRFDFGCTAVLSHAYAYYSSGLLFLR